MGRNLSIMWKGLSSIESIVIALGHRHINFESHISVRTTLVCVSKSFILQ